MSEDPKKSNVFRRAIDYLLGPSKRPVNRAHGKARQHGWPPADMIGVYAPGDPELQRSKERALRETYANEDVKYMDRVFPNEMFLYRRREPLPAAGDPTLRTPAGFSDLNLLGVPQTYRPPAVSRGYLIPGDEGYEKPEWAETVIDGEVVNLEHLAPILTAEERMALMEGVGPLRSVRKKYRESKK